MFEDTKIGKHQLRHCEKCWGVFRWRELVRDPYDGSTVCKEDRDRDPKVHAVERPFRLAKLGWNHR